MRPMLARGFVTALLLLSGCGAFLAKMNTQKIERPSGKDCVRYQMVYRQPHLGNDQWGPREFVRLVYPAGPGSYHSYGEYVRCPAAAPGDPQLVELWRAWRKELLSYPPEHRSYQETASGPDVAPLALTSARPPETESEDGALYRIETYDAFFRGCDYWATLEKKYQCAAN